MQTILQVVPELDAGGVERTTVDIARAIVQSGGRALVATLGGRMEQQLASAGAEIIAGPFHTKNPVTIWANAGRLAKIIKEEKVALIHARSRAPAWSAKWAAERTHIPLVTTYAGIYNAQIPLKRWYNSVMASGDMVIANSGFTAQHIRDTYPNLRKPIAVIPRGIDLRDFDPKAVPQDKVLAIRKKWLAPDGARIVLMPGRLTRWKGSLTFVEAMAAFKGQPVYGVLAGDAQSRDSFEEEVLERIETLGLNGQVRYVGHMDDMALGYAASDVVVSASLEPEAFGRVAVEAQAMRKLIVATDLGAARETVLPDQSGWLVRPKDPRAMAAAISDALNLDPLRAEDMKDRGRAHVMRKYDVAAMCRATLQVYAKLLGEQRDIRAAE